MTGILVSRSGFQSGATALAGYCGICLMEIREPDEREWRRYARRFAAEGQAAHRESSAEFPAVGNLERKGAPYSGSHRRDPGIWRLNSCIGVIDHYPDTEGHLSEQIEKAGAMAS